MSLRAAVDALTPAWRATPEEGVALGADVHHPQGLCRAGGLRWLATADVAAERGYVLAFDDDGTLVHRVEVTDGRRYHPGGIDVAEGRILVPVAENRAWSSTTVVALDPADATVAPAFGFPDHLGAVGRLPGGDVVAVTWASRELLRLGPDGEVRARRTNPSHYLDVQDLQVVDAEAVLCTGLLHFFEGERLAELGGVALLDPTDLTWRLEVPLPQWSPTGRALTHNPVRVEERDGALVVEAVPDDGPTSRLLRLRLTPR